jgi:hypothetical protein
MTTTSPAANVELGTVIEPPDATCTNSARSDVCNVYELDFSAPAEGIERKPTPLVPSAVQFDKLPLEGVPNAGVTNVGEVANTNAPVPVSSVTADIKFAELGVARNVATPVPNPLTPVEIGKPETLVSVPELGVPSAPPDTNGVVPLDAAVKRPCASTVMLA